mmetsp:Transcript_17239/g.46053  ORF Transcript_17239/g.46053 Transcript_17239/m.46053 type:complete len:117 (-) Transcript_17239:759-1109(-)
MMVKWKGALAFKCRMPAKPIKDGIKSFALIDAKTGYTLRATINDGTFGTTEKALFDTVRPYLNENHCLVADNFYTGSIIKALGAKKTSFVGTTRIDRLQSGLKKKFKKTSMMKWTK